MARRLPGTPPVLPGYTHVRTLGTGGFADVFLYQQSMPRRTVAVKVLVVDAVQGDLRSAFLRETNTLAQLSTHPHVLTMYEAGIAADGRPYLVTEYCPSGYGERFRSARIPVTEVIDVGLGVGAALHTAHGMGVLHRDLKPANVLITGFSRPVLADFGIAATLEHAREQAQPGQEDIGLSVPWAAPEILSAGCAGSVASEVYSFGAMLYGLLAGRSPYELTEGRNDRSSLARRILGRATPGPLGRDDVPPALASVIAACLSQRVSQRPEDVLAVLRRLQLAQDELGLRPSSLELAAPQPGHGLLPEAGREFRGHAGTATGRLGSLAGTAGPTGALGEGTSAALGAAPGTAGTADGTGTDAGLGAGPAGRKPSAGRGEAGASGEHTASGTLTGNRHRAADATTAAGRVRRRSGGDIDDATRRRPVLQRHTPASRGRWALAVGGIAVLAAGAVLAWWRPWHTPAPTVGTVSAQAQPGGVRFDWSAPSGGADEYEVRVQGRAVIQQPGTSYTVQTAATGERVCVSVAVVRKGTVGPASPPRCERSQGTE